MPNKTKEIHIPAGCAVGSKIVLDSKMWRQYVKYLIKKNPGKPLKTLLKNYDKKEYASYKANPKLFV